MWWARPTSHPALSDLLDRHETARHQAYVDDDERLRFATAAALLRVAVARSTGQPAGAVEVDRTCPTCDVHHGRPRLPAHPDLHVSVSHAGDRVVVACARGRSVGVDVEGDHHEQALASMQRMFLSPSEQATVLEDDPLGALVGRWVVKEAVLKCRGTGLTEPMTDVLLTRTDVGAMAARWAGTRGDDPEIDYDVVVLAPGRGYRAALAVAREPSPPRVIEHRLVELVCDHLTGAATGPCTC